MMLGVSMLSHTNYISAVSTATSTTSGGGGGGSRNLQEGLENSREQDCTSLLHQCKGIEEFKQIHAQFAKLALDRGSCQASALVKVCAISEWGSINYARKLFDYIDKRSTFEFNVMIRGYVTHGSAASGPKNAFLLYREMLEEENLIPDKFTFPFVLKACAHLADTRMGMQLHGHVLKFGMQDDAYVLNSLINMYGRCGDVRSSCCVFEQMGSLRDVASWSTILVAHAKLGLWGECLKLFEEMCTGGWKADESSLTSILSSCAHLAALDVGMCIHCFLLRNIGDLNVITQTSLIDMYVKCGHLQRGMQIFRNMKRKNVWTYSVMISGLAMHGESEKALWLFADMLEEGLAPDETVYVGVLSACSHAGLLAEGLRCFDKMRFEHCIKPTMQHYCCMVDLMGRAGELQEAYKFVKMMPMEPNESIWRCLLNFCRIHGNLDFAAFIGRNLLRLDTRSAGDYVLLSNIYSQAQKWEEAGKLRTEMVNHGFSPVPGFSRIVIKKEINTFVSQDMSHPQRKEIYDMLHQMEWQLKFEGYRADKSQVLLCVDEEEKKRVLRGHSQKLAIAYGLISTSPGEVLRISRNLRMCSDCHTYTKMISMIFDREIIVRDRNYFHHFREGTCSCRDYW